jgi:hypothetical protein
MKKTKQIINYEDAVISLMTNKPEKFTIKNFGIEHFRLALKYILNTAEKEINWVIYDESLYNQFLTRELYDAIKRFVTDENKVLRIFICKEMRSSIFRTCLNNLNKYIKFYPIVISGANSKLEFLIWDNIGYRITVNNKVEEFEAALCANDVEGAAQLTGKIKNIYEPIKNKKLNIFQKIFNFLFTKKKF